MSHGPMGSLGSLGLPERFRDLCRVVVRRVVVRVAVAFLKRKKIFLFKRQQLPEQLPGSEIHFSLRKASIFGILVDLLAGTCARARVLGMRACAHTHVYTNEQVRGHGLGHGNGNGWPDIVLNLQMIK